MDSKKVKKMLGQNIKKYRKKLRLTQSQLGKKINIDQRQVAYIENGHSFPSLTTLLKFAEAFSCDLKNLFEFEVENSEENIKNKIYKRISKMKAHSLFVFSKIFDILEDN